MKLHSVEVSAIGEIFRLLRKAWQEGSWRARNELPCTYLDICDVVVYTMVVQPNSGVEWAENPATVHRKRSSSDATRLEGVPHGNDCCLSVERVRISDA